MEIQYGIFCDYAHTESSGKISLIGIWSGECVFETPPPWELGNIGFHTFIKGRPTDRVIGKITLKHPDLPGEGFVPVDIPVNDKGGISIQMNFTMPTLTEQYSELRATVELERPALTKTFTLELYQRGHKPGAPEVPAIAEAATEE